jgi:hypothetical protein
VRGNNARRLTSGDHTRDYVQLFSRSLLIDVLRTFSHSRDGMKGSELDLFGTGRQGIVSWLLRNQEKDHDQ